MTPKVLVFVGTKDWHSPTGQDWGRDAYTAPPAPKTRLDNFDDAEHGLGGSPAFNAAEATDENPDRVTAARVLFRAHLRARVMPAGTRLVQGHRGPRLSSHCSRPRFVKPSGWTLPAAQTGRRVERYSREAYESRSQHHSQNLIPSRTTDVERQETGNQADRRLAIAGTSMLSCATSSTNGPATETGGGTVLALTPLNRRKTRMASQAVRLLPSISA